MFYIINTSIYYSSTASLFRLRKEDDKMKIKERWVVTELKDEKNPDKVYYVSDMGRIMTKDLSRKKKRRIEFDPAKSKATYVKEGYKYHVQRRPIKVRKLVYYSFNSIPLDERRTIVSKDGNVFNVRLDNLEDRSKINRIYDEINLGCIENRVRIRWGRDELWIEMGSINFKSPSRLYYISNKGRVGFIDKEAGNIPTIIRDYENGIGTLSKDGYCRFRVSDREYYIHRLVACYFYRTPYSSPLQVHHINGIKHDNRLENLMWVNGEEHRQIEMKSGLSDSRIAYNKSNRRYSWDKIQEIREMYEKKGMTMNSISEVTGIDFGTIRQIVNYTTYKTP